MKKTLTFLFALAISLVALARPVSADMARVAAVNYWQSALHQQLSDVSSVDVKEFSTFYVFSFNQNTGFVIISADDVAYPVLGYSTNSAAGNLNPEVRFWLGQLDMEIHAAVAGEITVDKEVADQNHELWTGLLNGVWNEPKSASAVPQLMTTTWNQSPLYNNYCPSFCPVGCLATAVAQVMKFWNHPAQGTGSHSYYSNYGELSVNFDSAHYDWENMPNALGYGSTAAQVHAVAELSYHVGVSMNMSYSPDGSGAYLGGWSNTAEYALKQYFSYNTNLQREYRYSYSDYNWVEKLKDEISEGRPVVYAGYDNTAGHAFVFDGYNTSNLFHVNWGWGGVYNGYFAMGALNPSGGGTGTNGTNTFNQGNEALFGVAPIPSLSAAPAALMFSADNESVTFDVQSSGLSNSSWHATSLANWLTVTPSSGSGMGSVAHVTATVQANNTGHERSAVITLTQDADIATVYVTQLACGRTDMCQLTVRMAGTNDNGWYGASLDVQSATGVNYGTAKLRSGSYAESTFDVCSDSVIFTWNNGSSDQVCSFSVVNSDGVVLFNHTRDELIQNGSQWVIASPCGTEGVDPLVYSINATSADTLKGVVTGGGEYEIGETAVLYAQALPGFRFQRWNDGNVLNPREVRAINNRTLTATFTTLGTDTLSYENAQIQGSYGQGGYFHWGAKFTSSDQECHGVMTGVRFYAGGKGNYIVNVYFGGEDAPDSLVFHANLNVNTGGANSWNTISFNQPVTLDQSRPLWVTFHTTGCYDPVPYACWGGNNNGSWYSEDGGDTWTTLDQNSQPIYGTWMIRPAFDYDPTEYVLTASSNRPSWGRVEGGGRYHYGAVATLVALPADGCHFVRWTDHSTENPHQVVITSDTTIRAVFAEGEPQGIAAPDASAIVTTVQGRVLNIYGAEGMQVIVCDLLGRQVFAAKSYAHKSVTLPSAGIYMVSIEGLPARKIIAY